MFKFFRRIRKGLLSENRFGKYLLYAIGEIILVVIGILIALNLNNQNEERKTEAKVDIIFSEIMEELISDIEKTTYIMRYYTRRDSMIYLVQNNKLTAEDYQNNEIPSSISWNLTKWHTSTDLTNYAYHNLTEEINVVPPKYKNVLKDLNILYSKLKTAVDKHDREMIQLLEDNTRIAIREHPWFGSNSDTNRKNQIEYMLHDFRYKNEVEAYRNKGLNNQLRWAIIYRQNAINCYKKIAEILGKPLDNESFTINPEIANLLEGEWQIVGEQEVLEIFQQDKRLFMKTESNRQWELFSLPGNKIVDSGTNYSTIVLDNNDILLKYNSLDLIKIK